MPTLVVILGATGVGKTELSLQLAEQYGCPIVSADSRQIYRALPIGTAAPTAEEQARVKHYFVGTKELTESYNAGQYARDCKALLAELFKEHEHVVMVGGSMMYIEAVCNGLDDMPDVSPELREQVRKEYEQKGLDWLQTEVERLDPQYWAEVDRQNPQRLMHCVEICRASGKAYSEFRRGGDEAMRREAEREFDVEYIMVERPREELYERINLRVVKMVEAGLLDEAKQAFEQMGVRVGERRSAPQNATSISGDPAEAKGEVHPKMPRAFSGTPLRREELPNSLNTVGYKELLPYFRGEYSLDRAIELIQQNSRHYAKRQLTWWRRRGQTV